MNSRIDRVSKVIDAKVDLLYQAFIVSDKLEKWIPPTGMNGKVLNIDAKEGGGYTMILTHQDKSSTFGKTSETEDRFNVHFDELVPNEKIAQRVVFDTDIEDFQGEMIQTWILTKVDGGVLVEVTCKNVPPGISQEDHFIGLNSSLNNLAAITNGIDS